VAQSGCQIAEIENSRVLPKDYTISVYYINSQDHTIKSVVGLFNNFNDVFLLYENLTISTNLVRSKI
jgi:hypothetical protein